MNVPGTLAAAAILSALGACMQKEAARGPDTAAPVTQAGGAADVAAARQAIEAANAKFIAALEKGDTAGTAANYAADAVVMMPNAPAWKGHDEIARGMGGFMSQFTIRNGAPTTSDVMLAGDLAIETGTYAWTITPKKGKAMTDRGKYLTVWKRQADGSWKIIRDINNSDLPGGM